MDEPNVLELEIMKMGFTEAGARQIIDGAGRIARAAGKRVCPIECAKIIQEDAMFRAVTGLPLDMKTMIMRRAVKWDEEAGDDRVA